MLSKYIDLIIKYNYKCETAVAAELYLRFV